ncbi:uncharacterized protein LOC125420938 [Ziziphus jujuba]|uniref:Uncharacterized protein LOC125420938 n=2 Tax=Ziziphus jujuba TaxID=326968 RepID=A0ABM3IAP0_ZIZJJ|nr:uncharacterized protein LOC125420938 [Ziziphus jujuba]KAH7543125.1 hypothetical protein FEM48_Zijuj02G0150000 [Ziziphus jujuba var. spinosa]
MAHPSDRGFYSRVILRVSLVLMSLCFVLYTIYPSSNWRFNANSAVRGLCPPCHCDCYSDDPLPLDFLNSSFADCGIEDSELNKEMEKGLVGLYMEELELLKIVANETLDHTRELIMDARRASSHYQHEAEKCNAGVVACEEARERVEAQLRQERKLSLLWEKRARDMGWIYIARKMNS